VLVEANIHENAAFKVSAGVSNQEVSYFGWPFDFGLTQVRDDFF